MNIRLMNPSDLEFAAQCAADVGWLSTTRQDFETALAYDAQGCFIAREDGRRVGMCIATNYGTSGFVGNLIVVQEMRGQGIGHRLLEHGIAYLHRCGVQNVLLDGVPAAVSLYERAGFRHICQSLRFEGQLQGRVHPGVRTMCAQDLDAVFELDRAAFDADRRFFLERSWALNPRLGKVLCREGEMEGFILGRQGTGVVWVGPWVVTGGAQGAERLLESLAAEAGDQMLGLGVLETNAQAVQVVRSLGLRERRNPSRRMALGASAGIGLSQACYAIGSPAKG